MTVQRRLMRKNRFQKTQYRSVSDPRAGAVFRYKVRAASPMLLYMVFYLVVFKLLENWSRLHYTIIHNAVDDLIPFCPVFVIPYLFWFVYVSGFAVYMLLYDEDNYHELCTFLVIGMTAFLTISILFPNILLLRPRTLNANSFCSFLCTRLYAIDTPTNVTPSIHVYNSIGVMIASWRTNAGKMRALSAKLFMAISGFLIILSTMFIKQHSFSDVIIATGFALFSYILVYKMGWVIIGKEKRKLLYQSVFGN